MHNNMEVSMIMLMKIDSGDNTIYDYVNCPACKSSFAINLKMKR